MISDKLKLLSSSEIIRNKIDDIIEAFVTFYGEERREEITQKLKSVLIIKFSDTTTISEIINKIKQEIIKETLSIDESKYMYINIDKLIEILETGKDSYFSDDDKELIIGEVIPNEEIHKRFKEGKYPKLEEIIKKYKEIKPLLEPYEDLCERELKKREIIEKKYYDILVEEFKYLIPEEEIKDYKKTGFTNIVMKYLLGLKITKIGSCFDNEHEEKLKNPKTNSWAKESIERDRAFLLRNMGVLPKDKNGNIIKNPTYSDYLQDEKCIEAINKLRIECEKISRRQKELYKLQTIEIIENLEDYKKNRKEIEDKNFVNKDDPLGAFVYKSPVSCYHANYTIKDGQYVLSPLILINSGMLGIDTTIIHELNHALEYHTISIEDKIIKSICGWDYEETEIKDHKENDEIEYSGISRKYELISEYVNDRLAQEITSILHGEGKCIFFEEKDETPSGYMVASPLLASFYQKYKETIIESRREGNIEYLFEIVGKQNFEELNSLVNAFYKDFGFGFKMNFALADYLGKKDTEGSRKMSVYIMKRDIILAKMARYSKEKKTR